MAQACARRWILYVFMLIYLGEEKTLLLPFACSAEHAVAASTFIHVVPKYSAGSAMYTQEGAEFSTLYGSCVRGSPKKASNSCREHCANNYAPLLYLFIENLLRHCRMLVARLHSKRHFLLTILLLHSRSVFGSLNKNKAYCSIQHQRSTHNVIVKVARIMRYTYYADNTRRGRTIIRRIDLYC